MPVKTNETVPMQRSHRPGPTPHRRVGARALAIRPQPRTLLSGLLLAGLLATAGVSEAASRIYKTVDENGNVVFTDQPPRPGETGESVELTTGNTFTPPPRPAQTGSDGSVSLEDWLEGGEGAREDGESEEGGGSVTSYQSLAITSPANDAAVRENAGNVTISAAIQPSLAVGHIMQVYLDGQLRQQGFTTSFQLVNLDRGTHNVQVRVVDQSGNTLIASEPSVFHLQRRSVILQPNRAGN